MGLPSWLSSEDPPEAQELRSHGFDSWVRKIPEGTHGNSLQYSCLGDLRSLAGYSP